jgi:hypothetical protein
MKTSTPNAIAINRSSTQEMRAPKLNDHPFQTSS